MLALEELTQHRQARRARHRSICSTGNRPAPESSLQQAARLARSFRSGSLVRSASSSSSSSGVGPLAIAAHLGDASRAPGRSRPFAARRTSSCAWLLSYASTVQRCEHVGPRPADRRVAAAVTAMPRMATLRSVRFIIRRSGSVQPAGFVSSRIAAHSRAEGR